MTKIVFNVIFPRAVFLALRCRVLRAIPILIVAAVSFGCAASEDDSALTGDTRYLADVPVPASGMVGRNRVVTKTWVGRGARDVCGNSWSIELNVTGNKVVGEFWLRSIKYDIVGYLDSAGRMDAIPGRKSAFYKNYIGPREMQFSVTFKEGVATGEHHFSYGLCLTPMQLVLSKK